jgi:hypothetical protein
MDMHTGLAAYAYQLGYAQTVLRKLMPNGIGSCKGQAFTARDFDKQFRTGEDQAYRDLLAEVALRGYDFPAEAPTWAIKPAAALHLELPILTREEWNANECSEQIRKRLSEKSHALYRRWGLKHA